MPTWTRVRGRGRGSRSGGRLVVGFRVQGRRGESEKFFIKTWVSIRIFHTIISARIEMIAP